MLTNEQYQWLAQYLSALIERNNTLELRHLDENYVRTMYITGTTAEGKRIDWERAIRSLVTTKLTRDGQLVANVFHTVQRLHPSVIARAPFRFELNGKATSKTDILEITHLVIDIDVQRPAGVPATSEEHALALEAADCVGTAFYNAFQVYPFAFIDTGNGVQIIYRVETEIKPSEDREWKRAVEPLFAIAEEALPDRERLHIDRATANPTQLVRFPFTWNRKGYEYGDLKHRMARLMSAPNLDAQPIIIKRPEPEPEPVPTRTEQPRRTRNHSIISYKLDELVEKLTEHGYGPEVPVENAPGFYRIRMKRCPFNHDHDTAAAFYNEVSGVVGFNCFKCEAAGDNPTGRDLLRILQE
jgi:hypothetical protein